MQIASRQALWTEGARGTVVEVEMTKETGLYFKLAFHSEQGMPLSVAWGDGARAIPGAAESGGTRFVASAGRRRDMNRLSARR